jgi:hypothetical protein
MQSIQSICMNNFGGSTAGNRCSRTAYCFPAAPSDMCEDTFCGPHGVYGANSSVALAPPASECPNFVVRVSNQGPMLTALMALVTALVHTPGAAREPACFSRHEHWRNNMHTPANPCTACLVERGQNFSGTYMLALRMQACGLDCSWLACMRRTSRFL